MLNSHQAKQFPINVRRERGSAYGAVTYVKRGKPVRMPDRSAKTTIFAK